MREIIFRGKRKDNGEWVEGYFCRKYFPELPHDRCVIQYKIECTKEWRPDYMVAEVIPETVGQYTGLPDKNGKKIFTKDIVAIAALGDDHHQKGVKTIAVVEDYMGNTCLCIDGKHQTGTTLYDIIIAHTVEVVGDTIDNPELLKGGG